MFEDAVHQADLRVDWTFTSTRNWMIVPTRLIEEAGRDTRYFNDSMAAINREDQDFCAATAEDLERILLTLEAADADASWEP
ncbi:hypothetical protein ACFU5O_18145 [Streptomyces sp. NPDC057445]|uniref:hypothetical protein n=1 Tax=Streptomyces sp. NPDC057445 TaxID=3346136 RepID=UPI0036A94074